MKHGNYAFLLAPLLLAGLAGCEMESNDQASAPGAEVNVRGEEGEQQARVNLPEMQQADKQSERESAPEPQQSANAAD